MTNATVMTNSFSHHAICLLMLSLHYIIKTTHACQQTIYILSQNFFVGKHELF